MGWDAQIFQIRRTVRDGEKERERCVWFYQSSQKQGDAKSLLKLNQQHWHRENVTLPRDVTLGEDACQIRIAGAPQALAAINGGILALMDWLGVKNVAQTNETFLCATSRSFAIYSWQVIAVRRD